MNLSVPVMVELLHVNVSSANGGKPGQVHVCVNQQPITKKCPIPGKFIVTHWSGYTRVGMPEFLLNPCIPCYAALSDITHAEAQEQVAVMAAV